MKNNMKVAYTSFSKTALTCIDRIQGIHYSINKILKNNNIEYKDYFKNPDVVIFEINDLGSFCNNHLSIMKTLDMVNKNPKIILTIDDWSINKNSYINFIKNINKYMPLNGESYKTKIQIKNFVERILNKEFFILYGSYYGKRISYMDELGKETILFDYSHVHDYLNLYKPLNRKIISYSFRKENNLKNAIVLSGLREVDCFKILCENRICYMKDYPKKELKYWIRNRHAQAYYANALVVGSKDSCFGKDYEIEPEEALKMSDEEFELTVKRQQEIFIKNTDCYEVAQNKLLTLLNN